MIYANDNHGEPLRFLSVCSGIEAASVAWHPLGWRPVAFSEIEKFPSAVLAHHYPDVPNLGDFTKIATTTLGQVDILCGGTPCQAFSVAGLRQSLDDARGNLSLEFVRLAHELAGLGDTAGNGLRNVVWENVVGVLSTKDNAFGCFLAGLVGADDALIPSLRPADGKSSRHWKWRKGGRYPVLDDDGEETGEYVTREPWHALTWPNAGLVAGPKGRAAWRIQDAQYHGLAQRRRRVLVVADFGNGADPAQVLFELDGVQRHSAPSREAGQNVAPTISARTKGGGGLGTDFDLDGGVIEATYAPEIARCVATREGSSQDYETTTMVAVDVAPTMRAGGNRTGGDRPYGTDVDTCDSLAMVHAIQAGALRTNPNSGPDGVGVQADIAYTLEARAEVQAVSYRVAGDGAAYDEGDKTAPLTTGTDQNANVIAFSAKDYGGDASFNISPTLRAGGHSGSHANAGVMPAIALTVALRGREGGATAELGGEVATALRASSGGGDKPHVLAAIGTDVFNGRLTGDVAATMGTRGSSTNASGPTVLTSAVRRLTPTECERLQGFPDGYTDIPWRGKPTSPDGPRYKALGNSWAVPKFVWLGRRIAMHMPAKEALRNAA